MQHTRATKAPSLHNIERLTGGLMMVYMAAVAVQVAARTASTNSSTSLAESLETLASNHGMYLTS
ncbi:MAG TPA: hypothetical protein VFA32_02595, partial [Dehalococcoidia bacterium]|nr:hypothetical protein [Dehalococcoidia bacterium]